MEPPKSITFNFKYESDIYKYLEDAWMQASYTNAEELGFHCIKCNELLTFSNSRCNICKHWSFKKLITNNQESMYDPAE